MKTYIVQLENHDDFISTRDKISWGKARRVLLVWPRHGSILDRRVDLVLLQRLALQMGIQIGLVTGSWAVKEYARELGIPVFPSLAKAHKSAWRGQLRGKDDSLITEHKLAAPSELREQRERIVQKKNLKFWARVLAFTLGLGAFFALVLFFLPGATIKLHAHQQQQELSMEVWANPKISSPTLSGGVPAFPVQVAVEGRETAASTGQTLIPDGSAAGRVELTNLTDLPVSVPAGSILITSGDPPVRFLTTQAVEVSGQAGSLVQVPIRAALPGSTGNVPAGAILSMEGALGLRLKVNNPESTTGGGERSAPAPDAEDYDRLSARLLEQLQQTAVQELQNQMEPGQNLMLTTLRLTRVLNEDRQPEVNQPGDHYSLALRAEYEAWFVKETDLVSVVQTALNVNIPPGFHPLQGPPTIKFSGDAKLDAAGSVRWNLVSSRTVEAEWSTQQVIRLSQGLDPKTAARNLQTELPLAGPPQIELFPSWWVRMPFLAIRMQVVQP